MTYHQANKKKSDDRRDGLQLSEVPGHPAALVLPLTPSTSADKGLEAGGDEPPVSPAKSPVSCDSSPPGPPDPPLVPAAVDGPWAAATAGPLGQGGM